MNNKNILAITLGTILAVGTVGGLVLKPLTYDYVAPLVKEKLDTAINGEANYDSLDIGWTGKVVIKNLTIKDKQVRPILSAPEVDVSLSPLGAIKAGLFGGEPMGAISDVTLKNPNVIIRENKKGQWNVSNLVVPTDPEKPFAYRGDVNVKDGKGEVIVSNGTSYHFSDINGRVDFGSYPKAQGKVGAKVEGQPIQMEGSYDMKGSDFTARLLSQKFALQKIAPLMGAYKELKVHDGYLTDIDLRVTRKDGQMTVDGKGALESVSLDYENYSVRQGQAYFIFDKEWVTVSNGQALINSEKVSLNGKGHFNTSVLEWKDATIGLGEGSMKTYGWYNLYSNSFHIMGDAHNLDFGALGVLSGQDVRGFGSGTFEAIGAHKELTYVKGKFQGQNVRYGNYYFNDIEGAVSGKDGHYIVPYINGTMNGGTFTASGTYNKAGILDGVFAARNMPLSTLNQASTNMSITGQGDINGTIKGSLDNPDVTFAFGAENGMINGISYLNATGRGTLKDGLLQLDEGIVNTPKGTFALDGQVGLRGNQGVALQGHVQNVRAEHVLKEYTDIPITGWLDANVTVSGTTGNPQIEGEASLRDGSIMNQLIQSATAHFTYDNQTLTVPDLEVHAYDSVIKGSGTLQGKNLDFTIDGEHINTQYLMENNPYNIHGYADVHGTLTGTVDAPVFKGYMESKAIAVNQVLLTDIHGNLFYDPSIINVQEFEFDQGEGHVKVSGGMKLQSKELFGLVTVQKGDIRNIIRSFDLPIHNLGGALDGEITLGGVLTNPSITVQGLIEDTTIKGDNLGTSTIDVTLYNKQFTIHKLHVPMGEGFLAAQGTADLKGKADMQIGANKVPIEYLIALSGKDIKASGILEGLINVSGTTQNPVMQLSATMKDIDWQDTHVDSLYALATLKDGVIKVNQILAQRGEYKASMYGTMPLKAFYAKANTTDKASFVNLKANLDNADLGILPLFIPMITKGEGKTNGTIEITGPLSDLAINGDVIVKDGTVYLKDVKKPFDNINATLAFKGKHADLDVYTTMGKGKGILKVTTAWENSAIKTYEGTLVLDKLELDSPIYKGLVKGNFEFKQGTMLPKIIGHIDLDNTTINIPLTLSDSQSSMNANLDITVEAPNKFRLYNSVLYDMMANGKLHVGGTIQHPNMDGQFKVLEGTVKYLNNRFKVTEGRAIFNRRDTFLPSIDMKATTDVSNYKIDMALKGPAEQMDLSLTSTPALSEQQILSLLTVRTLDINDGNIEKNALNTLLSTGLQMVVFGSVENTLKEQLHLDKFSITNTYLDPYKLSEEPEKDENNLFNFYTLEIGKYMYKNLMLTAGTGLNYDLSRVGLEYKINKYFNASTWYTTDRNYFIGAQFKYRF